MGWSEFDEQNERDIQVRVDIEVTKAVLAEREACAKLVAQMGGSEELAGRLARAMAQAIRERSNVEYAPNGANKEL
jgi:phage gpG-like protein